MKKPLGDAARNTLFREARSYNRWMPEPLPEQTLHALYDLLKFGPTSLNCSPARFVFVTTAAAKARLVNCVSPGNVVKTETAPVVATIEQACGQPHAIRTAAFQPFQGFLGVSCLEIMRQREHQKLVFGKFQEVSEV